MKNEILFTSDELQAITAEAALHTRFIYPPNAIPLYSLMSKKPTDILRISPKHQLILTIGTEHTGLEHINKRHGFYNNGIRQWNNDKLDNPSKFAPHTIGAMEYVDIADTIYTFGTKKISPDHPGKESYEGLYKDKKGIELPYRLVTYENTKVIHTLFPTKTKHNVKQHDKFKWKRGFAYTTEPLRNNTVELIIPYHRPDKTTAYSISLLQNPETKTEEFKVIIHDETGLAIGFYKVGTRESVESYTDERNWRGYQFADLRTFEAYILKVDKYRSEQERK